MSLDAQIQVLTPHRRPASSCQTARHVYFTSRFTRISSSSCFVLFCFLAQ
jgi:hypothetical protein